MRWTRKAEPQGEVVPIQGPRRFPRDLWDYQPVGPHFTVECMADGSTVAEAEKWEGLDLAIGRFADLAIPIWPYWHWHVVDADRTVILGYSATDQAISECGPWGWWIGVQVAFDVLTRHHDPMEAAVWETIAKERAWS